MVLLFKKLLMAGLICSFAAQSVAASSALKSAAAAVRPLVNTCAQHKENSVIGVFALGTAISLPIAYKADCVKNKTSMTFKGFWKFAWASFKDSYGLNGLKGLKSGYSSGNAQVALTGFQQLLAVALGYKAVAISRRCWVAHCEDLARRHREAVADANVAIKALPIPELKAPPVEALRDGDGNLLRPLVASRAQHVDDSLSDLTAELSSAESLRQFFLEPHCPLGIKQEFLRLTPEQIVKAQNVLDHLEVKFYYFGNNPYAEVIAQAKAPLASSAPVAQNNQG